MLTRLKVFNYRSIKEVDLPLPQAEDGERLTVLIGPNASGKSGILDAPVFVRDLLAVGNAAWQLDRRGAFRPEGVLDFADLSWKGGQPSGAMTFTLEFMRGGVELIYGCSVAAPGAVAGESLVEKGADGRLTTLLESDPKAGGRAVDATGVSVPLGYQPMPPALARCNVAGQFPRIVPAWEEVSGIHKHVMLPGFMRGAQAIQTARPLDAYGKSLSPVLLSMKNDSLPAFNELLQYLRHHVPEVLALMTPLLEGGQTRFAIREQHLTSEVPASVASDGVLTLLALATIALQPSLPQFPTSCVLVEEPEAHLHQGLMPLVADLLRVLARRTSVLVTTHSPTLVAQFEPRSIVVVEKVDGATRVRPLAADAPSLAEALEVMNLGEAWMNGFFGGLPRFGQSRGNKS